jgi:hypothetical protein
MFNLISFLSVRSAGIDRYCIYSKWRWRLKCYAASREKILKVHFLQTEINISVLVLFLLYSHSSRKLTWVLCHYSVEANNAGSLKYPVQEKRKCGWRWVITLKPVVSVMLEQTACYEVNGPWPTSRGSVLLVSNDRALGKCNLYTSWIAVFIWGPTHQHRLYVSTVRRGRCFLFYGWSVTWLLFVNVRIYRAQNDMPGFFQQVNGNKYLGREQS